jgi:hypothetical protein
MKLFVMVACLTCGSASVQELALFGFDLGASRADAVVGRPLTPVSYAGVARRTTRRSVGYGAAVATTAVVGTTAVVAATSAARLTALPPGCVSTVYGGVSYQQCGSTYYQPVYDGPNLVYVEASPNG